MGWSFHKERDKRYQIVLDQLFRTFSQQEGFNLVSQIQKQELLSKTEKKLLKNLSIIEEILIQNGKNNKKRHNRFLKTLRQLLVILEVKEESGLYDKQIEKLCLELCKTKFYRIHLFQFGHNLLSVLFATLSSQAKFKTPNYIHHFSRYSLLDESRFIVTSSPLFHLERDLRKFNETITKVVFDPHRYNHPSLLYHLTLFRNGEIHRIKMVRMGCPTKESWFQSPQIIEEFKGLLKALKFENKNHLYVNKQRTWSKEGLRSSAIKDLQKTNDHFFCLCLPSDGAFYYQQNVYDVVEKATHFKDIFFNMLIGKRAKGYYHIPVVWLKDFMFVEKIRETLNQVHHLYFNAKEDLSSLEKRFFIEHCYTHLIILCLKYFEIHSVNITCRDGIDRAGCEQAKLLYYFHISLGIENEIESKKERQFLVHIPPYLAKNRPIVKKRRELLHQILNHYTPEVRKAIREAHLNKPLLYYKPHFVKGQSTSKD